MQNKQKIKSKIMQRNELKSIGKLNANQMENKIKNNSTELLGIKWIIEFKQRFFNQLNAKASKEHGCVI
jgi:hypothetical protein